MNINIYTDFYNSFLFLMSLEKLYLRHNCAPLKTVDVAMGNTTIYVGRD